jgi:hypothetical protein
LTALIYQLGLEVEPPAEDEARPRSRES